MSVTDWLMQGDPAIRWQTMRDLLDRPEKEWRAERGQTLSQGWGERLLKEQNSDGIWGGGIYSPKWVSSTYTLLTLCDIGIPRDHEPARRGAALVLKRMLEPGIAACDRCIVGMLLQLAVYFRLESRELVANLLEERMPDGGWNCRRLRKPRPHHSSFHTTLNVLDGVGPYLREHSDPELAAAEQRALQLLLEHRLFKSDKTGEVIDPKFTRLSFPHRWHYDVLRGLDYFARGKHQRDPRLQDAIELLLVRQRSDGTWPLQQKYAGQVFFDMEKTGQSSRWNTLRALRVLRWWDAS